MSTLQVANIWFDSTSNNRIQYAGSNSYVLIAGNANTLTVNTTGVSISGTSAYTGAATFSNTVTLTGGISGDTSSTGTVAMASSFKRNRIINGNMLIDQRNAGASVTPNNSYTLDRWLYENSQTGKVSIQQNAGSVTPPAGYTKYLGVTSLSAYSSTSSDYFVISQKIEGFNVADLNWGTASAQTITISFWVRSSLTGTNSGALVNNASNRSYSFTYTVSAANTWEQKTVTISGDTSGTWLTDNSAGIVVRFNLGSGSSAVTTAGSWLASNSNGATGSVSVVGTSSATFYITGVQLEVGTKATPYEMQIYSDQLAQCQRYYNAYSWASTGWGISTTQAQGGITFPVMRTSPTISDGGSNSITYGPGGTLGGSVSFSSIAATRSYLTFTASGGQTTNYPCVMYGIANMAAEL